MECQYCKNSFSNKVSLINHQKTAKYCLDLRSIKSSNEYMCEGCNKKFTRSSDLERHRKTCKKNERIYSLEEQLDKQTKDNNEKDHIIQDLQDRFEEQKHFFEKTIKDYKQTITNLQDKLENIALKAISRPTQQIKQTNNQVINLAPFDLTPEKAKLIFETKYTPEYFLQGMKGLTNFVSDHIIKTDKGESIYACYDRSRDVFKYKNEAGEIINDIKAIRLVEIIHPAAKETGSIMNDKYHKEYTTALSEYDEDKISNKVTKDELDLKEIKFHQALDSMFIHNYLNTELDSFSSELGDKIKK